MLEETEDRRIDLENIERVLDNVQDEEDADVVIVSPEKKEKMDALEFLDNLEHRKTLQNQYGGRNSNQEVFPIEEFSIQGHFTDGECRKVEQNEIGQRNPLQEIQITQQLPEDKNKVGTAVQPKAYKALENGSIHMKKVTYPARRSVRHVKREQNLPPTPIQKEIEARSTVNFFDTENKSRNSQMNKQPPQKMQKTGTFGMLGRHKSSAKRQMMYDSFVDNGESSIKQSQLRNNLKNKQAGGVPTILDDREQMIVEENIILPPQSGQNTNRPSIITTSRPPKQQKTVTYSNVPSTQVKKVIRYSHQRAASPVKKTANAPEFKTFANNLQKPLAVKGVRKSPLNSGFGAVKQQNQTSRFNPLTQKVNI